MHKQPKKPDNIQVGKNEINLNLSGVVLKSENGRTIIRFDKELFKKGTKLKTNACAMLTALGKQLEPYKNQITLQVTGYTDDLPMPPGEKYPDNTSLGLSRALMVVEHLRATTGLSNVPFTIRTRPKITSHFDAPIHPA